MLIGYDGGTMTPERKTPHPLKVGQLYEKGVITTIELALSVFESLREETLDEFLGGCSAETVLKLREFADTLPADNDDDGWAKKRFGWAGRPISQLTVEEAAEIDRESRRNLREGVRLFRSATNGLRL